MHKEDRLLRIGVLGCGPISQAGHFDATRKARNAELYAICDQAEDLLRHMAATHLPHVAYNDYGQMLADPRVEAVILGVADQFHVPLALRALEAGKHVLVEKPLGATVEECEALRDRVIESGLVLQVGTNKRFDPGLAFAHRFIRDEIGELMAVNAWYCDSVYRRTMTDNVQPVILTSEHALRPEGDPKSDRRRYNLMTHGSHLVDTARFLGGPLESVEARRLERFGAYSWDVTAYYESGCVGHLQLIVALRGDWEEGFRVAGEKGSVKGEMLLPWFHKSGHVECFSTVDGQYRRVLGEDAYTYKLQIEGFADTILKGAPQLGADVEDGLAAMRALVAISRSAGSGGSRVRLDSVEGGV